MILELNEIRTTMIELHRQKKIIEKNDLMIKTLNGMNIFVIILNKQREVIFINKEFCDALNINYEKSIGMRPGELLHCKFASVSEYGCGFSDECSLCVAKNLVVEAIHSQNITEGQVSIISIIKGLEVSSIFHERVTALQLKDETFYMAAFVDKSSDVAKDNLERIFFHDILNSASSLYNIIRLLKMENKKFEEDEDMLMVESYIKNIIEEIEYHRSITFAENNELTVTVEHVDVGDVINKIVEMLLKDERFIKMKVDNTILRNRYYIETDKVLLHRIFINMLKNALEANDNISIIRIYFEEEKSEYRVVFHNNEVIPMDVQREMFGKGKTTKGKGRGIGTYGSKLLLNKYLNGDLSFVSNEIMGTNFIVTLPKEKFK